MEITTYKLWDEIPGTAAYEPWVVHYKPEKAVNDSAFVLIPGSGYANDPDLPKQEGDRVAKYYKYICCSLPRKTRLLPASYS